MFISQAEVSQVKNHIMIGAVAAAAAATLCSAGIASADQQVVGQTYDQAKQELSKSGMTIKIGTTVGDELPTGQCVVTQARTAPAMGTSGETGSKEVILDLNCNKTAASTATATTAPTSPTGG